VSARCFGDATDECVEACLGVSDVLATPECAELWFELGLCVDSASCDVVVSDGLERFCGPTVERLTAECGIDFDGGGGGGGGGGSDDGGGSGGSAGT
jgi:hypothetical protein